MHGPLNVKFCTVAVNICAWNLASCHFSGPLKIGMATTFMVHLYTPVLNISALKDVSKTNLNFKALSQICKNRLLASSRLSVRPSAWNNTTNNLRIFVEFVFVYFFENPSTIFKFH